jgi:hypothetical protein
LDERNRLDFRLCSPGGMVMRKKKREDIKMFLVMLIALPLGVFCGVISANSDYPMTIMLRTTIMSATFIAMFIIIGFAMIEAK